jgi:hypothetical protein
MATTTSSLTVSLPVLHEAVKTEMARADAFSSSQLAAYRFVQSGALNALGGRPSIGKEIQIPHWSLVGAFEDLNDGVSTTPKVMGNDYTTATIARSALSVDITRWAEGNSVSYGKSLYQVFAEQLMKRFNQHIDAKCIAAAASLTNMPSDQIVDAYSATTPEYLSYQRLCDAKRAFGDRMLPRYGMLIHSAVYAQYRKQVDGTGRPLYDEPMLNALFNNALDIIVTDRMPISDGAYTVTSSGTTPPVVSLSGTPNRYIKFRMECTTLGARGTAVVRTSINGGLTWKTNITTAATFTLVDPDDNDASTGVTVNYANASAAVDNVWTATGTQKIATMIVAPGSLAYMYDGGSLMPFLNQNGQTDSSILSSNVYYACARFLHDYGNARRPDVVMLQTNAPV